jgi:hypothetical protein
MNNINTTKLHRLIGSLKKEEKRYFKLFTKKQNKKGDIIYLKIFDYLDKVEAIDRAKFKKKFQDVKGLSNAQSYLYKLILKSLRSQSAYNDIDSTLREGLSNLDILYKKELFAEAHETVKELLEIAELYDKIFFLPMLYEWWFTLETSHLNYQEVELWLLEQNITQYAQAIDNLKHYHLYKTQIGNMFFLLKDKGMVQLSNEIAVRLKGLPDYNPNQKKYGISVIMQELQLRGLFMVCLMDVQATFFYVRELSSLLKKQPQEVFKSYKAVYCKTLITQMITAPTLEIFRSILEEVKTQMKDKNNHLDNSTQVGIFLQKINLCLLTRTFNDFEQHLIDNPKIVEFLTTIAPINLRALWHYKMMLYYYSVNNYKKALALFDQFIMNKEVSIIVKSPSLFLRMVIAYQEQEYILLASFLQNFPRFLQRQNVLLNPEKQLIALIKKLIKHPQSEHKIIFINARKELIDYLYTVEKSKQNFLTYFNYIGWIDSQIYKKPFKELFFRHTGVIQFSE